MLDTQQACDELREQLENVSDDGPVGERMRMMADLVRYPDFASVPSSLRGTGADGDDDVRLASTPFAFRDPIPKTKPRPPPRAQSSTYKPTSWEMMIDAKGHSDLKAGLDRFKIALMSMDKFDAMILEGLNDEERLQTLINFREFSTPTVISLSHFCEGVFPSIWDMRKKNAEGFYEPLDFTAPLQDRSALGLEFIASYLKGTRDQDIVSQVTQVGVRFDAEVPYQLVILPHLVTMPPGFKATCSELERLSKLGYCEFLEGIPFCPWRTIQQGSVPRFNKPLNPRRTSNASGIHYVHKDDDGTLYVPLNTAIGSKDVVDGPFRFGHRSTVTTGLLGASSVVDPSPCALPNTKHPPETKPRNSDEMHDSKVLRYAGSIFGLTLMIGSDDMADAFNQFHVAQQDLWLIGFVWLQLGELGDRPLAFVAEYVLGFGYTNASGVCQRYMDSVMDALIRRMDVEDAPFFASRTAPAEVAWVDTRRELSRVTGRGELSFCRARVYSDDPVFLCLGVSRFVRFLRQWSYFIENARHRMSTLTKGQFGCHSTWNGAEHFPSLGVVVIPKVKIIKACTGLSQAIEGAKIAKKSGPKGANLPTRANWRKLCGLLQHLLDILQLTRDAMHLLYWAADGTDPGAPIQVSDMFVEQCERWMAILNAHNGVADSVVFEPLRGQIERPNDNPFIMTSDAAKEGTTSPGIGGYMHTYAWRIELSPDEILPISPLEYVAIAINLIEFGGILPQPLSSVATMLGSDSDNSVQDLVDSAAKAPGMQHVTLMLKELPEFKQLAPNMQVAQIYGEGNPISDAVSRGWWTLIASYEKQLGVKLRWLEPSKRSLDFLDDVRNAYRRFMTDTEDNRGKKHSNTDAGDGPTSPPPHSPSRRAASAQRRGGGFFDYTPPPSPQASSDPLASPARPAPRVRPQPDRFMAFTPPRHSSAPALSPEAATMAARARAAPPAVRRRGPGGSPAVGDSRAGPSRAAPDSGLSYTPPEPRVVRDSPVRAAKRKFSGVERGDQPVRPISDESRSLLRKLQEDDSPLALRPCDPELLPNLIGEIGEFVVKGVPENTARKEKSAWKHYTRACALLRTDPWRKNVNFDDPVNGAYYRERETLFWTIVVILVWRWMKPRKKHHKTARVDSALAVALSARRIHVRNRHQVPAISALKNVLAGMKQNYIDLNGAEALLPDRKEPLTDDDTNGIRDAPDGMDCAGRKLHWEDALFINWWAMLTTMRKSALRKADALSKRKTMHPMDLRKSHLKWKVDGKLYEFLTEPLLRSMVTGRDMAVLRPAGSKADPLAEYFGTQPIYLPYDSSERLNAAKALAEMEIRCPCTHGRQHTALFTEDGEAPLTMDLADRLFAELTRVQLGDTRAGQLSLHSPRVYLACALKSLGRDDPTIQALCRWKSPESIKIYGRLSPEDYAAIIRRTSDVSTTSVQAINLSGTVPPCDDDGFYGAIDGDNASKRMSDAESSAESDTTADADLDDDCTIAEFATAAGDALRDLDTPPEPGRLVCVPWDYTTEHNGTEKRLCIGRIVKSVSKFRGQTVEGTHYVVKFIADDSTCYAHEGSVFLVDDETE